MKRGNDIIRRRHSVYVKRGGQKRRLKTEKTHISGLGYEKQTGMRTYEEEGKTGSRATDVMDPGRPARPSSPCSVQTNPLILLLNHRRRRSAVADLGRATGNPRLNDGLNVIECSVI